MKARAKFQDREFEGDHLGGLEQRAHRQDRKLAALVVRHRLRGDDGDDVDVLGEFPLGLRGDEGGAGARLARNVDERARRREVARPGGDDEKITRANFRRPHVPPNRRIAAHVEEPHGEAARLQALAAETEDDDALRPDDLLDEPVERVLRVGSVATTLAGVLLLGLIFNVLNFENGLGWISLSAYRQSVVRGVFRMIVVMAGSGAARRVLRTSQ